MDPCTGTPDAAQSFRKSSTISASKSCAPPKLVKIFSDVDSRDDGVLCGRLFAWFVGCCSERCPPGPLPTILIDTQFCAMPFCAAGEVRDLQHRARYELGFSVTLADPRYPQQSSLCQGAGDL